MLFRRSNILDPVHAELDPRVWDAPDTVDPRLKPDHKQFIHHQIYSTLERHGYDGMDKWLSLVLTGSLTTYQYSEQSDCDISLWVDAEVFPEWSRAEMIGIMISDVDANHVTLPGTPHPLQCFVVASTKFRKEDLYKPGVRSGYDINTDKWLVPPDKSRVHDVKREEIEAYAIALENADKMEKLIRYEPDKAVMFYDQLHHRRMRDMQDGKGDFSPSNIAYKMLDQRGLLQHIAEISGKHIASLQRSGEYRIEHTAPGPDYGWQMHDMTGGPGGLGAPDFYEHPEYYSYNDPVHDRESLAAILAARNGSDQMVTIHRAAPVNEFNPGDWVTPSLSYAQHHAKHPTDPGQDVPVWTTQVPAHTLWTNGDDLNEWGYHGPAHQGQRTKMA